MYYLIYTTKNKDNKESTLCGTWIVDGDISNNLIVSFITNNPNIRKKDLPKSWTISFKNVRRLLQADEYHRPSSLSVRRHADF